MLNKVFIVLLCTLLTSCSYPTLFYLTNLSGVDLLFFTDSKCKWIRKNDQKEKIHISYKDDWFSIRHPNGVWYYKFNIGESFSSSSNARVYASIEKTGKIFINSENLASLRKFTNNKQPEGFPLTPTKASKKLLSQKIKCL